MKIITDARVMQELGTIRADVDSVKTELAAKSAVKSVQRGSRSLRDVDVVRWSSTPYVDVTISAVNTGKSFVTTGSRAKALDQRLPCFSARLINANTLRVERESMSISNSSVSMRNFIVDWEVIEYA